MDSFLLFTIYKFNLWFPSIHGIHVGLFFTFYCFTLWTPNRFWNQCVLYPLCIVLLFGLQPIIHCNSNYRDVVYILLFHSLAAQLFYNTKYVSLPFLVDSFLFCTIYNFTLWYPTHHLLSVWPMGYSLPSIVLLFGFHPLFNTKVSFTFYSFTHWFSTHHSLPLWSLKCCLPSIVYSL